MDASPELRSKKQLIENSIASINEPETRKFLENAFRDGKINTTGTDIDKLMPPVSRFGGGGARAETKQSMIDTLKALLSGFLNRRNKF